MVLQGGPCGRVGHRRTPFQKGRPSGAALFSSLTPDLVHGSPAAMQTEVAALYHDVFGPIFLVLAAVYAVGILAAILLPAGTLSDRLETGPVESQPAPSRTEPALAGLPDSTPSRRREHEYLTPG